MLDPGILAEYKAIRVTKNTSIFCHAPFTSMNFEQNGNVTVCCYNRKYVLGLTRMILSKSLVRARGNGIATVHEGYGLAERM